MFVRLAVLALAASLAAAEPTCLTPATLSGPGRDIVIGDYWCPDQITTCAALCTGGSPLANTCISNNEGSDNPRRVITYCYECTCADGSTPDLAQYLDTIPNNACWRYRSDCPEEYAVEPTDAWYTSYKAYKTATTSVATSEATSIVQAGVTPTTISTAGGEVTPATSSSTSEDSTSLLITSASTSTSTSVGETTSTSSELSSSQTTTVQPSTTVPASTNTSSSTTRSSTSSTSSAAPVKSAGAAMVEPAVAFLGMGLAAIFAL